MLAADKDRLVAALKLNALELRQKELNYYVERYSNITTQASIVAGFAFDSLVELDVSSDMRKDMDSRGMAWVEIVYYAAAALTMAFALYTVCVSSFATVYGHRLALQGPTGSVERAVAVMMKQRNSVFITFGISMVCLVCAAISMAWIKMGMAAAGVSAVFLVFLLSLLRKHHQMKSLFRIPQEHMVQGDLRVNVGTAAVDISRLEAGFGTMETPFTGNAHAPATTQAHLANGNGKMALRPDGPSAAFAGYRNGVVTASGSSATTVDAMQARLLEPDGVRSGQ